MGKIIAPIRSFLAVPKIWQSYLNEPLVAWTKAFDQTKASVGKHTNLRMELHGPDRDLLSSLEILKTYYPRRL